MQNAKKCFLGSNVLLNYQDSQFIFGFWPFFLRDFHRYTFGGIISKYRPWARRHSNWRRGYTSWRRVATGCVKEIAKKRTWQFDAAHVRTRPCEATSSPLTCRSRAWCRVPSVACYMGQTDAHSQIKSQSLHPASIGQRPKNKMTFLNNSRLLNRPLVSIFPYNRND